MKGAPWHCGFPMRVCGGSESTQDPWVGWRCDECGHQQTEWGKLQKVGSETVAFVPATRRVLTVVMHKLPVTGEVMCRGISRDEMIFTNLMFVNVDAAVQHLGKFYSTRGFRCVFDLPKGDKP